jgi:hypothetical protein
MLAQRIIRTLKFFDLQNYPLSANELHRFLIADLKTLKTKINANYELTEHTAVLPGVVHLDTVLTQLHILEREGKIFQQNGFYCLPGRQQLIDERQSSYFASIKRERLLARYASGSRHLPFVRSVALLGSQAMGQARPNSDIDLFIITDPRFIGLARFFLTLYFQVLGVRRHGQKIANRICLNHYLAGPIALRHDQNLYTAYEYLKFRPLAYPQTFIKFLRNNEWVYQFFPNGRPVGGFSSVMQSQKQSRLQKWLERLFENRLGHWLEQRLLGLQLARIETGEFTISNHQEMSFHPNNRKLKLFQGFFSKP